LERRLAAIVAADVVGYTRLVRTDEEGTVNALQTVRSDRIEPLIVDHRGRIANTAGDSLLLEFRSVVDALRCAIAIQKSMADWNSTMPEGRQIQFRIGINLGDVIEQRDDLLGDGVNVAARLESIAAPGGITLSGAAYEQVRDRVDANFVDEGPQTLKNIPAPVHVYSVGPNQHMVGPALRPKRWAYAAMTLGLAIFLALAVAGIWWMSPWWQGDSQPRSSPMTTPSDDKPSIAVLPFTNMSEDDAQQYFSDGLTEDVITDLSKVSGLFVIARGSSFKYRGPEMDLPQVGRELGVSHLLTGSVRKSGELVRISARLIEVATGKHIWGARYDGGLVKVFTLQDEVTEKIVNALEVKLTDSEKQSIGRPYTTSVEAYDQFLRGRQEIGRFNRVGNLASRSFFERAMQLDPGFANAAAFLAWSYLRGYSFGWDEDPERSLKKAANLAEAAVAMDETKSVPHMVRGIIQLYQLQHAEAVASVERSLDLNPNYADSHAMLAFILNYAGFPDKAEKSIKTAMRFNPHHSYLYLNVLGQSLFLLGRYDEAAQLFAGAASSNPADTQVNLWLAASKAQAGQIEEAEWAVSELLAQNYNYTIAGVVGRLPFKDQRQADAIAHALRQAKLPE
jgi:adenylate cyclase